MEQGKFWEMNRLVFGSREPLEEAHLRKLTERAGCDLDLLDECLAGDRPEEYPAPIAGTTRLAPLRQAPLRQHHSPSTSPAPLAGTTRC